MKMRRHNRLICDYAFGINSSADNNVTTTSSRAPLIGIACMVVGGALLTLNDAVVKWLSDSYPVGEILFIRGLFVFIPVALIAWRMGGVSALAIITSGPKPHGPS
jgi:drug/metabolite transporter (DMT)-like permease